MKPAKAICIPRVRIGNLTAIPQIVLLPNSSRTQAINAMAKANPAL